MVNIFVSIHELGPDRQDEVNHSTFLPPPASSQPPSPLCPEMVPFILSAVNAALQVIREDILAEILVADVSVIDG